MDSIYNLSADTAMALIIGPLFLSLTIIVVIAIVTKWER